MTNGEAGNCEPIVTEHMRPGLELLWKAAKYARNGSADRWNFAIELVDVRDTGLTATDLRWLIAKGYVDHAREIDAEMGANRTFEQNHRRFRFSADSCFVLTHLGTEFVRVGLLEPLPAAITVDTACTEPPLADCGTQAAASGGNLPR